MKKIEEVCARWEREGRGKPPPQGADRSSSSGKAPPRYGGRRRRGDSAVQYPQCSAFKPSLGVDASELYEAGVTKYSSLARCCQKCVPASASKSTGGVECAGVLKNVLNRGKHPGVLGHWFPGLYQVSGVRLTHDMKDLRSEVLHSQRVQAAVQLCARTLADEESIPYAAALRKLQARARGIVYGMSLGISRTVLRLTALMLFWVFGRLFLKIQVQRSHEAMLLQAQKRGLPMVFLPCHKSHVDYIIMTFILYNMGVNVPHIAAGDNLKLPLVSWLVKKLGGFFIKRRMDSPSGRDVLYRKCLHQYMTSVMGDGENMEIFIEGSRSRSGKPCTPKAGLLSVLVDCVKEGVVDDILLVPVSISYDKLLERKFVRHELMGGSKKPETFLVALRGAWAMLSQDIGSVHVNFAQPYSLQEYLTGASVSQQSLLEVTNMSRCLSVTNLADLAQRKLVTALSHHLVYDMWRCSSLMPTSMVAFLLLTKHRKGVTLAELVASYQWLEETANARKMSVAFTGAASEAVHYALHYLGDLVLLEADILVPRLELPDVFELMHHCNQVSPLLILDAVVASSVCSLLVGEVSSGDPLEVSREEVVKESVFLCQLLAREFIFAPPCADLWTTLMEAVDSFVTSEALKLPQSPMVRGRRLPRPLNDSDEEEEASVCHDVMMQVSEAAAEHLSFLRGVLGPFIEAYWSTAISLLQLSTNTEESQFLADLQRELLGKAEAGLLSNVECCSMDSLRNAVKVFVDMDVVEVKNGRLLHVADPNRLVELAEAISRFKNY